MLPPIAVVIVVQASYWSGNISYKSFLGILLSLATVYIVMANWGYAYRKLPKAHRRKKRSVNGQRLLEFRKQRCELHI